MAVAELDARALNHIRTCRTCFGQGAKGVHLLRREVESAPGAPWVRRIPLGDAVKADALSCLRYLVDEVQVETLNSRGEGYSPLQLSVIWGKLDIMVYLLARGADPMLEGEYSVVDMARLRQERLREALERSGDGAEFEGFTITRSRLEPLIEEGLSIVKVLEGIESHGSYLAWAEKNPSHPLVKRFSKEISAAEPRYELTLLRSLVLLGRASLLPQAKRAEIAAEEAAQVAARAKEEQSLWDALVEAGFSTETAKEIRDVFRTPTVKALRAAQLTPDDIEAKLEPSVRQKRIAEGSRRKFARYVRELEESIAMAKAVATSKAAAKSAPKSKAKPAPAAKAALLAALGPKGAGRGAGAKEASKPKKSAEVDGFALLFCEDLPNGAFMLMTRFLFGL
mmetsp:Transcript_80313/g.239181  ORF Transcript_80313/g.239181 Transcript_80313/m.239181 type:complete len:396 (-) Transcript_80313:162-1349(-)